MSGLRNPRRQHGDQDCEVAPRRWCFVANVSPFSGAGEILSLYRDHVASTGAAGRLVTESSVTLRKMLRLSWHVVSAREQALFVRFSPYLVPALVVSGVVRRLLRRFLILHVPTPVQAGYREIDIANKPSTARLIRWLIRLTYPLACLAATRVIQNGQTECLDPRWIRSKSTVLPNPVRASSASPPPEFQRSLNGDLLIVGVAANSYYHGYERVIRGMFNYLEGPSGTAIQLQLVGPERAFRSEINLASRLGLGPNAIDFIGPLPRGALVERLQAADAALGVLAAHRTGLVSGSPLRHRLYLELNVPWISSLRDVGLADDVTWIFQVPRDETPIDLREVIAWIRSLNRTAVSRDMRAAATTASPSGILRSMF